MKQICKFLVLLLTVFSSCGKEMRPAKNSFEVVKFWNVLITETDGKKTLSSTEKTQLASKPNEIFYPMFVCENSTDFFYLESLQEATYTIYKKSSNLENEWQELEKITFDKENIIEITDENPLNKDLFDDKYILFFNKGLAGFSEENQNLKIAEKDYRLRENCKVWVHLSKNSKLLDRSGQTYKEEFTYIRRDGRKVVTYFIVKY